MEDLKLVEVHFLGDALKAARRTATFTGTLEDAYSCGLPLPVQVVGQAEGMRVSNALQDENVAMHRKGLLMRRMLRARPDGHPEKRLLQARLGLHRFFVEAGHW